MTPAGDALAPWLGRRSVSPRRLGPPAPGAEALAAMLAAALTGPDHGALRPWRVIEFEAGQRQALADLFEAEKVRRDPASGALDRQRAREHAVLPPALLAFVVCLRPDAAVPAREQWLAAGAALGNLLGAAHALGFGAIMLSGARCDDPALRAALGLAEAEVLAGFVSIGTVVRPPPPAQRAEPASVHSRWRGA